MAREEFLLPKMGESIAEATIIGWSKKIGDWIEEDETLLEIATDKVDSELPSPFEGTIAEILFKVGDIVPVGSVIAIINTSGKTIKTETVSSGKRLEIVEKTIPASPGSGSSLDQEMRPSISKRFYSPLVRRIAEIERLSVSDLEKIPGTGADGRVSKKDIVSFVAKRSQKINPDQINYQPAALTIGTIPIDPGSDEVEIIEMDRMRILIADHMVRSKHIAPHVTSFLEIDVTNLSEWRDRVKGDFLNKYGAGITFTPIFLWAVAKAIRDFPGINASVNGRQILLKKKINIGMAAATNTGNLIVPVLKNADQDSIQELAIKVNDLSKRARTGKLKPEEIQGGTFTLTNVGTFGNTMGTPIINQPQVAILSTGAIKKKPAVVETENGDVIEIRKFMFLSLSYDHRIVDGALGGQFLRRVGDFLEQFNLSTTI